MTSELQSLSGKVMVSKYRKTWVQEEQLIAKEQIEVFRYILSLD